MKIENLDKNLIKIKEEFKSWGNSEIVLNTIIDFNSIIDYIINNFKRGKKMLKILKENLLNLASSEKIHLNYYTGSGRFQKKSADWVKKIYYELLQFIEKDDLIYSNDAPRGGFCGDYIQIKNIEKFKEVFSKQIQELEEQKREEEEQKKLEEEKRKQEKIEKAKKYLPLFEEKKAKIKKIKEKEGLGYRTLENLLKREEIYYFFILYNNNIFKI